MDPKELKLYPAYSYMPNSVDFLKSWDGIRKERLIPLKADSEYTLDDLKNMLIDALDKV